MAGLRSLAENDLAFIIEDDVNGFGWPITIRNPEGVEAQLTGYTTDIAQMIDPDTGIIVSGRTASIALRISSLYAAGLTLPVGVADDYAKPWIVAFQDDEMIDYKFKITNSNPDRTLGLITCLLESYTE